VTTHDLPPTAGYLAGDHVRLRGDLGLLTRSLEEELAADDAERSAWLEELRTRGALSSATVDAAQDALAPDAVNATDAQVQATVHALHRYLTWTPSRLISVALSDLVGDRRTQNQPGTIDEYPNWRVPLAGPDGALLPLESVITSGRAQALAQVVNGS
jgi:4-alpha-glucanotransferase